jgi:hypothetical protein
MKKKRLLIGITAMIISVASAAAHTYFIPVQTYILARNSSTSPFTCANVGELCDPDGIYSCQIAVMITAPPGLKTVSGRNATCVQTLKHTSTSPMLIGTMYYDVQ